VQLLAAAQEAQQQAQPDMASPGRTGDGGGGMCESAAGQLLDRALLLCGATVCAYVRSSFHEAAVWGPECVGAGPDGGAPPGLQSFVQLPAQMMKAARGGAPLWVLRQLRLWLQDATLGTPVLE
jgi:hypothetical protein